MDWHIELFTALPMDFLHLFVYQSIAFYLQLFLLNNGLEISSDTYDYYAVAAVTVAVAAATMLYPSHI